MSEVTETTTPKPKTAGSFFKGTNMRSPEKPRLLNPNSCKPVGQLGEVLQQYDAPEEVATRIARRAGRVSGSPHYSAQRVERVIEETMLDNQGLPDWARVERKVGSDVSAIYKRYRR